MLFNLYAGQANSSLAATSAQAPSLIPYIWDVAFITVVIVVVRDTVAKMSSPKLPDFIMGTSPQITTSWGSYYQGSHEQLMGISRATFLRCRKTQQVMEYNQRRAIETSWERLLHPVTWGRFQKEEKRDTAVRFAETVEYIAQMKTQAPVELEEQQQQPRQQCMSELEKPAVDGEETGKGAVEDEAMSLAVADEEVLVETINKA